MRGEEGGHVGDDVHPPERGGRVDAQGAAHVGVAAADAFLGGLERGPQREKRVMQILPRRGERKAARGAVDEPGGQALLQPGEALGQGRCGRACCAGSGGDRTGFDDGEEEIVVGIEHC